MSQNNVVITLSVKSMSKNKYYSFFYVISMIGFVFSAFGMQQTESNNYHNHITSISLHLHRINRCFFNVLVLPNDEKELQKAKNEIKQCIAYLSTVKTLIQSFYHFKQGKIEQVFQVIANYSPQNVKDMITQNVIPSLSSADNKHHVTKLAEEIGLCFKDVSEACSDVIDNVTTLQDIQNNIAIIYKEYNIFFSIFKKSPSVQNITQQNIQKTPHNASLTNTLIIHGEKLKNHIVGFKEMPYLEQLSQEVNKIYYTKETLKQNTATTPSQISHIIPIISNVTGKIAWVPFTEEFFGWVTGKNATFMDTIISWFAGQESYDDIKRVAFPIIQNLYKRKLIRVLASHTHVILENPIINTIATVALEWKDNQSLVTYSNELQMYHFIELLECLDKMHEKSLELLKRENRRFDLNHQEQVDCKEENFFYTYFTSKDQGSIIKKKENLKKEKQEMEENIKLESKIEEEDLIEQEVNEKSTIIFPLEEWINTAKNVYAITKNFIFSMHPLYTPTKETKTELEKVKVNIQEIEAEIKIIEDTLERYVYDKNKVVDDICKLHKNLEKQYTKNYCAYKKNHLASVDFGALSKTIDDNFVQLEQLIEEKSNISWLNIYKKLWYMMNIRDQRNMLQQSIEAYNMAKIKTNELSHLSCDEYEKKQQKSVNMSEMGRTREELLEIFKLSNNVESGVRKNFFSPLERSEITIFLKNNKMAAV